MPFALAVEQEVCVWASFVGSAGMNMPLHQISVIPRDVTSSRVSGSGKAKDKDKQVCEDLKVKAKMNDWVNKTFDLKFVSCF